MSEHTTQQVYPVTITYEEYARSRRHQCAGPLNELCLKDTQERYEAVGANGWQIVWDENKGTILRPVVLED